MCSFWLISRVLLLLSYWLFFERFISHLLWPSCYLSSHPSHRVTTLSSNPLRCLCPFFCLLYTNSSIRSYYHCLSPPFCLPSPLHRASFFHTRHNFFLRILKKKSWSQYQNKIIHSADYLVHFVKCTCTIGCSDWRVNRYVTLGWVNIMWSSVAPGISRSHSSTC